MTTAIQVASWKRVRQLPDGRWRIESLWLSFWRRMLGLGPVWQQTTYHEGDWDYNDKEMAIKQAIHDVKHDSRYHMDENVLLIER